LNHFWTHFWAIPPLKPLLQASLSWVVGKLPQNNGAIKRFAIGVAFSSIHLLSLSLSAILNSIFNQLFPNASFAVPHQRMRNVTSDHSYFMLPVSHPQLAAPFIEGYFAANMIL